MSNSLISDILNALNREVLNQLDLAKAISHPGESGRAREQIIAEFFRKFVPQSFGISTGFVIDATGGISRQIDIVIYRTDYHPVFEIGGIKHFMVESVVAVLENKASIASSAVLRMALDNIRSVKALDRSNCGKNYVVNGSQQGAMVDPDNFQHQVFGAIVTEESLAWESLTGGFLGFLRSNPKTHWPNFYADVRHLAISYLSKPDAVTVVPSEANFLAVTRYSPGSAVPPLVALAFEVNNFLRVSPLVDYKPTSYMLSKPEEVNYYPLEE